MTLGGLVKGCAVGSLATLVLIGLSSLVHAAPGQSHLPKVELKPEVRALVQIKARMAHALEAIPNYTCAETIRRTQLNEKAQRRMEKLISRSGLKEARAKVARDFSDTVSLEVAVVDGTKIYSWPGSEFRSVPLAEIIGFGMVSSGSFSSFAKSLFVTSQGRIRYAGEEQLDGRGALRYDYSVSLFRSGYWVSTLQGKAKVGYEGSFWAREGDYQLLRLTVRAVDMPPELGLRSLTVEINYEQVAIGEDRLDLATSAVHEMTGWDGTLTKNETSFHNCRKFGVTSDLLFNAADEAPEPAAGPRAEAPLHVPPGSELHVKLVSEISSENSKVGDRVEARLRNKLVIDGRVVAEKGSLLLGRVRRIHRVGRPDDPSFAISLEFTHLRSGGAGAALRTELVRLQSKRNVSRTLDHPVDVRTSRRGNMYGMEGGVFEKTVIVEEVDRGLAGLDTFYVHGSSFRLAKGFQMTWRVAEPDPAR